MQSLVEALVESAFTAFLLMPQFAFEQTFMNKKTFLIRRQMLTQIFKSDVVFAGTFDDASGACLEILRLCNTMWMTAVKFLLITADVEFLEDSLER